jgi:hypothetical protein
MEKPLSPSALSRERSFVVACVRSLIDPAARGALTGDLGALDISRFIAVTARHRVEGLVWRALGSAGIDTAAPEWAPLAAAARAISHQGLQAALESARLQSAFAAAGIDLLFIKGLTVGQLAYGNPFVKMSWDIDVLVDPRDVGAATDLLVRLGYACGSPGGTRDGLIAWHAANKESVWHGKDGAHHVELHSRLADSSDLIATIGMTSPRQTVAIAHGVALPTLAGDELFAYLCVHGASSAWFRLKWVADFAGLLVGRGPEEIERLYHRSQELGAGRAAAQALLVAGVLFALPVPASLRRELERSAANRVLAAIALHELAALRAPTERPLGTAMIHLSQALLIPGASFGWRELCRQARAAIAGRRKH